jgi:hypothetical protein
MAAAIIGLAGVATSAVTSAQSYSAQKKAQRVTEQAQRVAAGQAARAERTNRDQLRQANRKVPNPVSLLGDELSEIPNLLTGPQGVESKKLRLGRTSLLGA